MPDAGLELRVSFGAATPTIGTSPKVVSHFVIEFHRLADAC